MDVLSYQLKSVSNLDAKSGNFRAYAAVFNNVDRGQDRIVPGAFARTLKERNGEPIPILWSHNTSEPIGAGTTAVEDDYGLAVTGELVLSVPRAAEVRDLMKAGVVKGTSIGYGIASNGYRIKGEVRELTDVDLFEWSLCVVPMNPLATVTAPPKSLAAMQPGDWDQFFRAGGFSKREADKLVYALRMGLNSDSAEEASVADALNFLRSRRKGI